VNRLFRFQLPGRFLSRSFIRRVSGVLLWALLAGLAVGVVVTLAAAGLRNGGAGDWPRWMRAHAAYFLVWRLMLYAALAAGWQWLRRRLRKREADAEALRRLRRAEIAAVLALAALEAGQWLQRSQ
jgi:hypothetical protein